MLKTFGLGLLGIICVLAIFPLIICIGYLCTLLPIIIWKVLGWIVGGAFGVCFIFCFGILVGEEIEKFIEDYKNRKNK